MDGYKVTIKETSRDLTARERVALKDTTNAIKLDEAVKVDEPLTFIPVAYGVLNIHNEKSDNIDYENFILIDKDGNKYVTGSTSLWTAFKEIWDEMSGEDEEYAITIYKMESKNYKGKHFMTCSIV